MSEWIRCPKCGAMMTTLTSGYMCPVCGYRFPAQTVTQSRGTSAEYVEIVRCKDCKFSKAYYHGPESNLGMFTYLCTQGLYGMNADDYCSRAERRDNDAHD